MTAQSESAARRQVVRTYLEMRDPAALRGDATERPGVRVDRRAPCTVAEYRALYRLVGEAYAWRDRLGWTDERLGAHLARPEVDVWVLTVDGATAGYFELEAHADGTVEILYFGIAAAWHGRGLGRDLLVNATRRAWERGATRVCLNTCTLDGPHALPNYLARGFVPYREETCEVEGWEAPPPTLDRCIDRPGGTWATRRSLLCPCGERPFKSIERRGTQRTA